MGPRFGERVQRFVAGDVDPMVVLISGYFRATYGLSIDLFAGLSAPIVERFEPADELGSKLQAALAEISGGQVGMQAMTTAILKQVLVTLVRRSLNSTSVRLERFPILSGDALRANQAGEGRPRRHVAADRNGEQQDRNQRPQPPGEIASPLGLRLHQSITLKKPIQPRYVNSDWCAWNMNRPLFAKSISMIPRWPCDWTTVSVYSNWSPVPVG